MQARLTTKPQQEVIAAIQGLDLESVKLRVMDPELGEGWSQEYADGIEVAYKNYLVMLTKYPDDIEDILISKDVDEFWHTHILQTRKYTEDCQRIFGNYIHHEPHIGDVTAADVEKRTIQAEKTRQLYEQEFGGAHKREMVWAGQAISDGIAAYSAASFRAERAAYCAASIKPQNAAYCAASIGAQNAAYCAASAKSEEAAYCAASIKPQNAAYCAASIGAQNAAYCAASAKSEEAAYCAASIKPQNAAYCAASIGAQNAAYCAASAKSEEAAYCAASIKPRNAAYCAASIKSRDAAYCAANTGTGRRRAGSSEPMVA
jgi:hypothetical protein